MRENRLPGRCQALETRSTTVCPKIYDLDHKDNVDLALSTSARAGGPGGGGVVYVETPTTVHSSSLELTAKDATAIS